MTEIYQSDQFHLNQSRCDPYIHRICTDRLEKDIKTSESRARVNTPSHSPLEIGRGPYTALSSWPTILQAAIQLLPITTSAMRPSSTVSNSTSVVSER